MVRPRGVHGDDQDVFPFGSAGLGGNAIDVFMRQFALILGLLVAFMFVAIFIARSIGAVSAEARIMSEKEALQRIQPVGQVHVAAADAAPVAAAPAPVQVAAVAAESSGESVYTGACGACHSTGALNAPKVGDTAAWEPRIAQGLEALVSAAVNGKNAMPARGGQPALSDADIRAAVEYMLEKTGLAAN